MSVVPGIHCPVESVLLQVFVVYLCSVGKVPRLMSLGVGRRIGSFGGGGSLMMHRVYTVLSPDAEETRDPRGGC